MNDFLRADSLASACAYKSGFTREWELTGLTGILQQIMFSQLVSQASQFVPRFSRHSCQGTAGFVAPTGGPAIALKPLNSPSRSCLLQGHPGPALWSARRPLEPWCSQATWQPPQVVALEWQQVNPLHEATPPKPLQVPHLFSGFGLVFRDTALVD